MLAPELLEVAAKSLYEWTKFTDTEIEWSDLPEDEREYFLGVMERVVHAVNRKVTERNASLLVEKAFNNSLARLFYDGHLTYDELIVGFVMELLKEHPEGDKLDKERFLKTMEEKLAMFVPKPVDRAGTSTS